jgi:hypothetical protein
MKTVVQEIKNSLSLPICYGWDRDFLVSILDQVERGRKLSTKQETFLTTVLERNSPAAHQQHKVWIETYSVEYVDDAKVLAKYYKTTGYFKSLVEVILAGQVPDRKSFLKMYNNKYATKVLSIHRMKPKYNVGDYIFPRASFTSRKAVFEDGLRREISWTITDLSVKRFQNKGALIIEHHDAIMSAANGAKTYKILPIGSTIPFIVEERFIKSKRT